MAGMAWAVHCEWIDSEGATTEGCPQILGPNSTTPRYESSMNICPAILTNEGTRNKVSMGLTMFKDNGVEIV